MFDSIRSAEISLSSLCISGLAGLVAGPDFRRRDWPPASPVGNSAPAMRTIKRRSFICDLAHQISRAIVRARLHSKRKTPTFVWIQATAAATSGQRRGWRGILPDRAGLFILVTGKWECANPDDRVGLEFALHRFLQPGGEGFSPSPVRISKQNHQIAGLIHRGNVA